MHNNSECLFPLKLLVNNHKCKRLSHGPGPGSCEPPLGRRGAISPRCRFAFSDGGRMGRSLQAEHIQGFRFEDFMFANDLQVHT